VTYQEEIIALADNNNRQVQAIYALYLSGDLAAAETAALMAAAIAQANSSAYALADLALAATIMVRTATPVPVIGVLPRIDEPDRLLKAATTVLDIAEDSEMPEAIVSRLARAEPLESAANAYSQAMQQQPLVAGWTRQRSPACCELCEWCGDPAESGPRTTPSKPIRDAPAHPDPCWRETSNQPNSQGERNGRTTR
jgi:hypothetical protein